MVAAPCAALLVSAVTYGKLATHSLHPRTGRPSGRLAVRSLLMLIMGVDMKLWAYLGGMRMKANIGTTDWNLTRDLRQRWGQMCNICRYKGACREQKTGDTSQVMCTRVWTGWVPEDSQSCSLWQGGLTNNQCLLNTTRAHPVKALANLFKVLNTVCVCLWRNTFGLNLSSADCDKSVWPAVWLAHCTQLTMSALAIVSESSRTYIALFLKSLALSTVWKRTLIHPSTW